jgi:hypothetical protein
MAAVLAEAGGNIVRLDVHDLEDGHVVDDIVVALDSGDPAQIGERLAAAGAGELTAWRAESSTADTVVRVLDWARGVVQAGIGYDDLEVSRALLGVCSADVAWVATPAEAGSSVLAQQAISEGRAQLAYVDQLPAVLADAGSGPAWLAAIVDHGVDPQLVALVARQRADRFTTTELARASALLALHRELAPPPAPLAAAT